MGRHVWLCWHLYIKISLCCTASRRWCTILEVAVAFSIHSLVLWKEKGNIDSMSWNKSNKLWNFVFWYLHWQESSARRQGCNPRGATLSGLLLCLALQHSSGVNSLSEVKFWRNLNNFVDLFIRCLFGIGKIIKLSILHNFVNQFSNFIDDNLIQITCEFEKVKFYFWTNKSKYYFLN